MIHAAHSGTPVSLAEALSDRSGTVTQRYLFINKKTAINIPNN
jgi:hypothetical protein